VIRRALEIRAEYPTLPMPVLLRLLVRRAIR